LVRGKENREAEMAVWQTRCFAALGEGAGGQTAHFDTRPLQARDEHIARGAHGKNPLGIGRDMAQEYQARCVGKGGHVVCIVVGHGATVAH